MWLCEMEMRELEVCVRDGDERARGLPEMERDEMEIERDRARLRQLENKMRLRQSRIKYFCKYLNILRAK